MGRRKIEIQPITHERNRSVTFLKRKNGLFKKAYELGVLCSVDVAVIIFEDRPGHDLKLHQYSSSDIREIVQRQVRHQGEKDLKGPGDFSGAGGLQFDDKGDGDDDGMEEEDEDVPVRSKKRRSGAKSSMHQDADGDSDYNPPSHRNGNSMPHLPPPPMHSSSRLDSPSGVGLPVSNDRVSSIRDSHTRSSKRPRSTLDSMDPGRRSPGSEMSGTRPPELYLPEQPGRYSRQIRHSHNMPPPPNPYHQPEQMQHPSQNFNPNYTPLFPVANQASPPPAFIPLHTDFVPSRNHPGAPSSFVRDMGPPQNSGYGGTSRARFNAEPQYDPALYPGAIRQQQTPTSQYPIHSPMHREDRVDMFDAFLEAERSRQQNIVPARGPGGLEWPNHEGAPSPPRVGEPLPRGSGPMEVSAPVVPQIPHGSNGSDSWFDMFSGANALTPGSAQSRSPRQGTSWERGSGTPVGNNVGASGGPNSVGPRDDPSAGFNSPALDKPSMRASDVRSSREGGQSMDGTANSGRGSKGASPSQAQDVTMQPPENATPVRVEDGGAGAPSQASKEDKDAGKSSLDGTPRNRTPEDGPVSEVAA